MTFSTRGSCPGSPLALVGVHTEVFRTERLRLSFDRVRRSLSTGFCRAGASVPEKRVFFGVLSVRHVPRSCGCEQGCELDCRAKAARRALPFFVVYPARSQRLIPSDPFVRIGIMLR